MTRSVESIEFQTAAQLIAALEKLSTGLALDEMYVQNCDGEELGEVSLEQEVLSDGSVAFNVVLSVASA
jgi:hypothetical protein